MKPRRILVYLLIFIAVGLFYYVYEVRLGEKQAGLEKSEAGIFDLKADEITAIRLRNEKGEFDIIKKGPDKWRLLKPIKTPADEWAVESLIRSALQGEKDRVFSEPVKDLSAFGLDKPGVSLTLLAGEKQLAPTLFLGGSNPAGFLYYARLGRSSRVFTVVAAVRRDLDKPLFDLRDKSLVLVPEDKIDGLRISGREEVELKKTGPGRWAVVKPESGPADNGRVRTYLLRALKGRVQKFIQPGADDAGYGFDRPRVRVRVLRGGKVAAEVVVGRAEMKPVAEGPGREPETKGFWARSTERPEVMLITKETAEGLDKTHYDFKERHVLDLEGRDFSAIEIVSGKKRLQAKKVKTIWEVIEPRDSVSRDRHIMILLMTLEDLRYVSSLGPARETVKEYGLSRPDLTIRLSGEDKAAAELSVSLKPVPGGLLAVRSGQGPVVLIQKEGFLRDLPLEIRPPEGSAQDKKKRP
ncbi:MAG: DUF4340 domain-containing protein [Thermodesulfobacteriota bacterium]|nr:DUF4340 domain-containing protein [Thermodesulfobacteriota bacterium]